MSRKRGNGGLRNNSGRSLRPAAKKARVSMQHTASSTQSDIQSNGELTPFSTTNDLWKAFGWSRGSRKSSPSEAQRKSNMRLNECDGPGWSSMVQTLIGSAVRVSEVLYPAGAAVLRQGVARAILDIESDLPNEGNNLVEALSEVSLASPRRSIQGRVARAVLVDALSKRRIAVLKTDTDLTLGGRTIDQAYKDYNTMVQEDELRKRRMTLMRFTERTVEDAVKFMLLPSNVGTLSWGHKKVNLTEHEVVSLPALRRRRSRKNIYEDYLRYCTDIDVSKISKGAFYNIITLVTCGEEKLLTAVDYVTGVLVNDQVSMLQRIGDDFLSTEEFSKRLTDFLELVRNFLRQQYDTHVRTSGDDVHTHGIFYGLDKERDAISKRTSTCNACSFVGFYFEDLRDCIRRVHNKPPELVEDALKVVNDIQEKMELYRGHRVRVANQQRAIQLLHEELKKKCEIGESTTHAVVVMDWKMKFGSMSARETIQQHFGKRGIGWHGFLASYYKLVETDAVRYTVYCDQILEGTNNQDALAVASMLEAFLRQIHEELPFIQSITLQSDNAGCYQTNELLQLLPLINAVSPVSVSRFIHTETQDGKRLIDAHFARGTSHIEKFMKTSQRNKIRKIAKPKGLAAALAWGGGIQNSFVQLVTLDRHRLLMLRERLLKVCAEAKLYFSRCNDCFFTETIDKFTIEEIISDELAQPSHNSVGYTIRVFSYSGIGDGVEFKISLKSQSFIPTQNKPVNELETEDGVMSTEDVPIMDEDESAGEYSDPQHDYIMESRANNNDLQSTLRESEQVGSDDVDTSARAVIVENNDEACESLDDANMDGTDGNTDYNAPGPIRPTGPLLRGNSVTC